MLYGKSNCTGFKGASGGPIVLNAISANTWHHIVFTQKGTTLTLYKNGVQVAQETIDHAETATPDSNFHIGVYPSLGEQFFKGKMAKCRVYDRELNSTEIKTIYDEEKGDYV